MAGPGEWGQDGTFYDNFESGSGSRYDRKIATVLFISFYIEILKWPVPGTQVFFPLSEFVCFQTKIGKN